VELEARMTAYPRTLIYEEVHDGMHFTIVKMHPAKIREIGIDMTQQLTRVQLIGNKGKTLVRFLESDLSCNVCYIKMEERSRKYLKLLKPYDRVIVKIISEEKVIAITRSMGEREALLQQFVTPADV
jgi:hypothetical protein